MQGSIERGVYGTATNILELQDGFKGVIYQDTCVVRWSNDMVILTAPTEAKTQTTKLRMNQASFQFDLGYIVVKRRDKWFVHKSKLENGKLRAADRIAHFDGYKVMMNIQHFSDGTHTLVLTQN